MRKVKLLIAAAGAIAVASAAGSAQSAFPGRNGQIVFQREGQCALFVMNGDGSVQRQLTDSCDTAAVWSPSGRRIAFQRGGDSGADVYLVNPDGTGLAQVTFTNGFDGDPTWSGDGRRIAFESQRTNNSEIWSAAAAGGSERQLTNHPAFDGDPAWSPDSSKIAFTSLRDGNYEIYVMNADGSGLTRLTNDGGAVPDPNLQKVDQNPSWSPDGRRIVFDSTRTGNLDVFVMNADGSGQSNLTDHPALDALAVFSPDGTKIAFVSERGGGGNRDIYTMTTTGASVTRLTSTEGHEITPDWGVRPATTTRGGTIMGTHGPDTLRGTIGPDTIHGLRGDDRLFGGNGNDRLLGGPGNDFLDGQGHRDRLEGGTGNDRFYSRDGKADVVIGGPGRDRATVDRIDRVVGVETVIRPKRR